MHEDAEHEPPTADSSATTDDIDAGGADVIGWSVRGTDGPIGEVADQNAIVGRSQVVVETGGLVGESRRLVPTDAVIDIDARERVVTLALSVDDVEVAPHYAAESVLDAAAAHRVEVDSYEPVWVSPSR